MIEQQLNQFDDHTSIRKERGNNPAPSFLVDLPNSMTGIIERLRTAWGSDIRVEDVQSHSCIYAMLAEFEWSHPPLGDSLEEGLKFEEKPPQYY